MKMFWLFLKMEFNRLLNGRVLVVALLFTAISLYFVLNGVSRYKYNLKSIEEFKKLEVIAERKYLNYNFYGLLGFNIKFLPPPISIFFYNSSFFSDLTGYINAGVDIDISNSVKGKNMFNEKAGGFSDFSSLLSFMGCLITLFYGFDALRNKQFLKFLKSFCPMKRLFAFVIITRFILLGLFFGLVAVLGLILVNVEGITLQTPDYLNFLYFFLVWMSVVLVTFAIGTIIGTIRTSSAATILIITSWLLLVIIFPIAVNKISISKAHEIDSNFQLDDQKWRHMIGFEERSIKEIGRVNNKTEKLPSTQSIIEEFIGNEYKKMQAIDQYLEDRIKAQSNFHHTISLFSPMTFFSSTVDSISGKGDDSIIDFYHHTRDVKHGFVMYYKYKRYYSNETKVVSFKTGDALIFKSKSKLPGNTLSGIALQLFYFSLFCWFSYTRYKKTLLSPAHFHLLSSNSKSTFEKELKLKPGEYRVLKIGEVRFPDYLYGAFSGCKTKYSRSYFTGINKLFIDEKDITENPVESRFLYLCNPEHFPDDIRAGNLIELMAAAMKDTRENKKILLKQVEYDDIKRKRFNQLDRMEKFEVLLFATHIREFNLFLFHDIAKNMPIEAVIRLKGLMEALAAEGAIIIFITSSLEVLDDRLSRGYEFREMTSEWSMQVERYDLINRS